MSRTNIIALLIFGAILGYFLTFGADTTRKFKAGVYQLLTPFLTSGSGLRKQITSVRTGLKSLDQLERENAALQVENRALRATNQGLRDIEHEVNRLRHALNYRERSVFKLIAAEVVTRDSSTWWRTVTINRGKSDGIETDMPVVTDVGLVGKTTTVSDSISVVLLVSDENCKVAASVEGTREQGIVSGERVTARTESSLESEFLVEASRSKAWAESVYIGGRRRFSLRLARWRSQNLSGARVGWASAAHAGGRSLASGRCLRGNWPKMIFFFLLLVLVLIAQIAEFFIPALPWLYNAHIYIVPVIVFYGAMALPFPLMLALALYAGLLLDALTVQVIGGKVEISMGSSILLYGVLAGFMHGLRPLFVRGRWEVHCILSGICTSLIVLAQYLMITFRRGSLVFTPQIWWQIAAPGLIAMAIAPILFWFLQWMGRMTAYSTLPERSDFE